MKTSNLHRYFNFNTYLHLFCKMEILLEAGKATEATLEAIYTNCFIIGGTHAHVRLKGDMGNYGSSLKIDIIDKNLLFDSELFLLFWSCPGVNICPYFLDARQGKGFEISSNLGKGFGF